MNYSKNLQLANQKYYKYLVDVITEGTIIMFHHYHDNDYVRWISFCFDDKNNHTSYRAGDQNSCTIFNNINATRRITNFLVKDGLQPKEIPAVIEMLKQRWAEDYGIVCHDYNYGLPYKYTKYKWEE